jgi:pyruvate/2-oxoglutarate dehydrogenase complex dihydrolipoamide dehydrogenase (E3) component
LASFPSGWFHSYSSERLARLRQLQRRLDGHSQTAFPPQNLRLLAVHILGENATELVHIGQAVIDHGGSVEYFRDVVFNYRHSPKLTGSRRSTG